MPLLIPFAEPDVTLEAFAGVARQFYEQSVTEVVTNACFDLSEVNSMDLLPASLFFTWSSKLRISGKSVQWVLPGGSIWHRGGNPDLVAHVRSQIGEEAYAQIDKRIRGLMHSRYSSHTMRVSAIHSIREEFLRRFPRATGLINDYFAVVKRHAHGLKFVAFLERWDFLAWADRMSIQAHVDAKALESFKYRRPDPRSAARVDTVPGTYPLRCLASQQELADTVELLAQEDTLTQIFANYSTLDIFSSGAFAKILVDEIGMNIFEHAISAKEPTAAPTATAGHFGFITTQILSPSTARKRSQGSIASAYFGQIAKQNLELLEVVIADDGPGIYQALEPWMREQDPSGTRFICPRTPDGNLFEKDVLIHSFDRLVSSKRDFVRLIHFGGENPEEGERISSGLYWVWQVVKSHQGLLILRSDKSTLWFDFTAQESTTSVSLPASFPFCGVQIAVYLPLVHVERKPVTFFERKDAAALQTKTEVAWLGHIRPASVTLSNKDVEQILARLKSQYISLGGSPVFAIDLSGIHTKWVNKHLVSLLAHFFVELNYTSATHQSAVVLWNVPSRWEGIIRPILTEELTRVVNKFPKVAALRPVCLLIWDDERLEVASISPIEIISPLGRRIAIEAVLMSMLLQYLSSEHEMDIQDIWLNIPAETKESCRQLLAAERQAHGERAETFTAEDVPAPTIDPPKPVTDDAVYTSILYPVIQRNSHLVRLHGSICRMHTLQSAIESKAKEQIEHDVTLSVSREIREGRSDNAIGILRSGEQRKEWYLLPSGGYCQSFFQFSVMLSDSEWLSRVAWWFSQKILDHYHEKFPENLYVASVTRSTIPLLGEILAYIRSSREFYCNPHIVSDLRALTLEEMILQLTSILPSNGKKCQVVIVTDVVSRGHLVSALWDAWSGVVGVDPACIITLLDTRTEDDAPQGSIPKDRLYSMIRKPTQKLLRESLPANARVVEIDRVNVCPVEPNSAILTFPAQATKTGDRVISNFFSQLDLIEEPTQKPVCRMGHFSARNYHHYTFYPNPVTLLFVGRDLETGVRLIDSSSDYIIHEFDSFCDFRSPGERLVQDIIAIHPDPDASTAGTIVRQLQSRIGFTRSLVLYRDRAVGSWLFTPFLEHGVDLRDKYALVFDDGCCSGQTLMAMIECAINNNAKKVSAFFILNRMNLLSTEYFRHSYEHSPCVRVHFLFPFHIPVYDPQACPICRYLEDLDLVRGEYPIQVMTDYCRNREQALKPVEITTEHPQLPLSQFPWPQPQLSSTARLRQARELSSLVSSEHNFLRDMLDRLFLLPLGQEDGTLYSIANQFAYLIVTPELCVYRRAGSLPPRRTHLTRFFECL